MFSHSKYFHFLPRPRENVSASRDTEIQKSRLYQRAKPRGKATSHLIRIEENFSLTARRTFSFGVNRKVLLTTHFARKWRRRDAKEITRAGRRNLSFLTGHSTASEVYDLFIGIRRRKARKSTNDPRSKVGIPPDLSFSDSSRLFAGISCTFPEHMHIFPPIHHPTKTQTVFMFDFTHVPHFSNGNTK